MPNEFKTDYEPGDFPVPVGVLVEYEDRGLCRVIARDDPEEHPHRKHLPEDLTPFYPDGKAYTLWLEGVHPGMDNSWAGTWWVRRTSFRIVPEGDDDEGKGSDRAASDA